MNPIAHPWVLDLQLLQSMHLHNKMELILCCKLILPHCEHTRNIFANFHSERRARNMDTIQFYMNSMYAFFTWIETNRCFFRINVLYKTIVLAIWRCNNLNEMAIFAFRNKIWWTKTMESSELMRLLLHRCHLLRHFFALKIEMVYLVEWHLVGIGRFQFCEHRQRQVQCAQHTVNQECGAHWTSWIIQKIIQISSNK